MRCGTQPATGHQRSSASQAVPASRPVPGVQCHQLPCALALEVIPTPMPTLRPAPHAAHTTAGVIMRYLVASGVLHTHLVDGGRPSRQGDQDPDIVQVVRHPRLVLNIHLRLAARNAWPAGDRDGHLQLAVMPNRAPAGTQRCRRAGPGRAEQGNLNRHTTQVPACLPVCLTLVTPACLGAGSLPGVAWGRQH
jgi:hypothetical protein